MEDSLCGAAVFVDMSGGTGPHYVLPVPDILPCPFTTSKLAPGETIRLYEFLPASSTGTVTLQSGADFLQTVVGPDGSQSTTIGKSPLDGLWPSITMSVAAAAPANRRITLQQEGTQVQISAPRAALAHLYYLDTATCNSLQEGTVGVETAAWQPISGTILDEPNCGDYGSQAIRWSYVVSAPGYSIAFDAGR